METGLNQVHKERGKHRTHVTAGLCCSFLGYAVHRINIMYQQLFYKLTVLSSWERSTLNPQISQTCWIMLPTKFLIVWS